MNTNIDWLIRRGVSLDTQETFGIRTDTHLGLENCLVIPVYTPEGTFSFNKYRRDPTDERKPKYLYDKGGKVTLFAANHLTPLHDYVVITEGELDALVLWSLNIPAVSSTGGALSFQEEWVHLLEGKQVYVCLDNDDAGAEGMVKIHSYLPNARFIFIPETPNTKDITDFISRGGDFVGLLDTALSYKDETAVLEDMRKRSASWLPTRFHTAWVKKHHEEAQRVISSPVAKRAFNNDKTIQAKSYPIPNLLKFNRSTGKALCPFHNEKTPSLHYYKATNTTYCFGGCGKAYDAIAIYQKLHNTDFRTTIEDLNKLI
jgi:DNA primase